MLPVLFHSAILTTYQEACKLELDTILAKNFEVLTEKAINISRNNEVKKYQDLIGCLKPIEQIASLMNSINSKFISSKSSFHESDV